MIATVVLSVCVEAPKRLPIYLCSSEFIKFSDPLSLLDTRDWTQLPGSSKNVTYFHGRIAKKKTKKKTKKKKTDKQKKNNKKKTKKRENRVLTF